jgi:hypothetical protein
MRSAGPPLRNVALAALVVLLLAGLPLAIWLDLRDLTEATLRRQAADLNSAITSIRGYYATNVVGRTRLLPARRSEWPLVHYNAIAADGADPYYEPRAGATTPNRQAPSRLVAATC